MTKNLVYLCIWTLVEITFSTVGVSWTALTVTKNVSSTKLPIESVALTVTVDVPC